MAMGTVLEMPAPVSCSPTENHPLAGEPTSGTRDDDEEIVVLSNDTLANGRSTIGRRLSTMVADYQARLAESHARADELATQTQAMRDIEDELILAQATATLPDSGTTNTNNTTNDDISSDLPPEWAWVGWRMWCLIQGAGNVALLVPTILALLQEPLPICDLELYNYTMVQVIFRALQILLCAMLAASLPRLIRRYTFRISRRVKRITYIWIASVIIVFAQIINVPVGLGLLLYSPATCSHNSPIAKTNAIICMVELAIFIAPAILVYLLPCLSGFLLSMPTNFAGASPNQVCGCFVDKKRVVVGA